MKGRLLFLPAASMVLAAGGLRAEEIPVWPVHWMCGEAEGIVLGERVGANRVKVLEWFLQPAGPEGGAREIDIAGLEDHSRVLSPHPFLPGGGKGAPAKVLKTPRLVCFLERKGVAWYSIATVGNGSSGLVWIEKDQCHRYQQVMNPGPLTLAPDQACPTEAMLRQEIARGLADRKDWEAALKVANPEEQAIILVSYLLPRNSPEGDRKTYLGRVRQVLPKLGGPAVRELIELLRHAEEGDDLNQAVLVLHDLGAQARAAVPHLVPLLEQPARVHPVRVLEALGRIGDTTVAHQIMPFLGSDELAIRAEVAQALAQFGYRDAAEQIAKAVPEQVEEAEAYHLYALLRALKELDPERAAVLARKFSRDPAMKHMGSLLRPLLKAE